MDPKQFPSSSQSLGKRRKEGGKEERALPLANSPKWGGPKAPDTFKPEIDQTQDWR